MLLEDERTKQIGEISGEWNLIKRIDLLGRKEKRSERENLRAESKAQRTQKIVKKSVKMP